MFYLRKPAASLTVVLLLATVLAGRVWAKGDPVEARIEGPGLGQPIELTDLELMSTLNPWAGEFAEWDGSLGQDPPDLDETYRVSVYTDLRQDAEARDLVYVFYYHPNNEGQRGLIYLPGKGEEWYETNVSTIYAGRDGQWHPAREALDSALRPLLRSQVQGGQGAIASVLSTSMTTVVIALALALLAAAILGRPALNRLRSA